MFLNIRLGFFVWIEIFNCFRYYNQVSSNIHQLLYNKLKKVIPKILMKGKRICLFDIDGTLTKPRNIIEPVMLQCLERLKQKMDIGFVGGSDFKKIQSQLTPEGEQKGKYLFSENGLLAFENGKLIGKTEIGTYIGEEKLQKFINFCLKYLSEIELPCKRGTFIEYRTGLINVSPIGRNCSQEQRDQFEKYDYEHNIRKIMIEALKSQFPDINLIYSIGGQISFDVFPQGWDKTYCLKYLQEYQEIYFMGDKTFKGGNDYELYELLKEKGRSYSVKNFHETIKIIEQKFLI